MSIEGSRLGSRSDSSIRSSCLLETKARPAQMWRCGRKANFLCCVHTQGERDGLSPTINWEWKSKYHLQRTNKSIPEERREVVTRRCGLKRRSQIESWRNQSRGLCQVQRKKKNPAHFFVSIHLLRVSFVLRLINSGFPLPPSLFFQICWAFDVDQREQRS